LYGIATENYIATDIYIGIGINNRINAIRIHASLPVTGL